MRKNSWWVAVLALAAAASCGPAEVQGPLTSQEQDLVGRYYRPAQGSVPGGQAEIEARVQRSGGKVEEAQKMVQDIRSDLDLPREELALGDDRSFQVSFGKSRSEGRWWMEGDRVILRFPKDPLDRNPLSKGRTFRMSVGGDGSLRDLEGGSPYLKERPSLDKS